jgi:hypothetical protein
MAMHPLRIQHRPQRSNIINGGNMSSDTDGGGVKFTFLIGILLFSALAGFIVYKYSPVFNQPQPGEDEETGIHKIDKGALIANLEKQIRAIPAENAAANLDGYKRLLKMVPGNVRYRQKVDYYTALIKETATVKKPETAVRGHIKVGYPAPRVLDYPETGQMLGRVDSGSLVEVLDSMAVASGSLKLIWYKIRFGNRTGWLSKLGTTGDIIEKPLPVAETAEAGKPSVGASPWGKLAASIIEDYGGKIVSIDRLNIAESHFSLYSGMNAEQVRQTCENIGYYIRNSTGESPDVVVFVDRIPVARAQSVGTKYIAKLITK